jgi:hypothetical protein
MVFIVAFQPANATASQPVAVTFPNIINTAPGTNMVLMTLDPTRGQMVPYGTGTVSPDGTAVIPDLDPARPGKRSGLVHFDWHGPMPPPPSAAGGCRQGCCPPGGSGGGGGPCPGCCPFAGMPVNLSFGEETLTETDIAINSPRGAITNQWC